ncbi:MAG TPA: RNA polymerase sigma factor WhiG [Candidatus Latescibacteria bacterium]|nr:RNA polymerase sigma factor WhiG [Candidatus Latescibacterota bacterium]|tara:strand:+ start:1013 stop:1792 length:780 start_codon:yes stop_codon:yes gene_type:complete
MKGPKKSSTQPAQAYAAQAQATDAEREKQLMDYLPLVKYIAGRIAIGLPKSVELDDLINAGVVGLIEAHNNFDSGKGVKFESYASMRIRGAILDELRAIDWAPRSTRAKSREVEKAISSLENRLGRSPNEEEVSENLDMSLNDLYKLLDDVSATTLLSLDEFTYGSEDDKQVALVDTLQSQDRTDALSDLERDEMRVLLVESIGLLSDQERLVIALYYYEELTLKEIGQVMELSESRVSQIHTKSVLSLRAKLRMRLMQ